MDSEDDDKPFDSTPEEEVFSLGGGSKGGLGYKGKKSSGYRGQLQDRTQKNGKGYHAHHVFPRKFSSQFNEIGIDNSDPQYGAWWEAESHLANSFNYNQWWEAFFATNDVTAETAKTLAMLLASMFGFDLNF